MMTKARLQRLHKLELELGIKFNEIALLNQSLTHSSYVYESNKKGYLSNERLEFLGDVVLALIVSHYIYQKYPNYLEGSLAKMRATVVSRPVLAKCSRSLNLGKYLLLGKGEESTGGRERESILADTFEALIGAIYLDKGFEDAKRFVVENLAEEILLVEKNRHIRDNKTLLQEFTQERFKRLPRYEVIRITGPDHCQRFEVKVLVGDKIYGVGEGPNKKRAEQEAAKKALEKILS
jgi:ribonuclease-3